MPESIGRLSDLRELYLGDNELARLPDSLGHLTALTTLYLTRNRLDDLPESIGRLTGLTTLFLDHNRLESLPIELSATALRHATVGTRSSGLGELKLGPPDANRLPADLLAAAASSLDDLWHHLRANHPPGRPRA